MYLIDTNIFIEIMLSRERSEECKELLSLIRDNKIKGLVTDFTIHLIMILLERFGRVKELKMFLLSLRAYKGLWIYYTSISDELKAVDIVMEGKLDLDDAIQYSAALATGSQGIISFDRDFDSLEIPRLEPQEVLGKRAKK